MGDGFPSQVDRNHQARIRRQQSKRELEAVVLGKHWTIEFQIADFPRPGDARNIPFSSNLTLREEACNIEAMEFNVSVRFIKLSRIR
jgi:hypothetical protein